MNKLTIGLLSVFLLVLLAIPVFGQEEATKSSDAIREKVQEKVDQALNTPLAYIGTITDISESTLQISKFVLQEEKEKTGEIQQVSTNEETVFVSVGKKTETVDFEDVAIGDFVVAMGFVNGNSVLEAERVLITEAFEPTEREAVQAVVSETAKGELGANISPAGEEITIKPEKGARITMTEEEETEKIVFTDIEEGDEIIAVGVYEDEVFTARRIHVLTVIEEAEEEEAETSPFPSLTPESEEEE